MNNFSIVITTNCNISFSIFRKTLNSFRKLDAEIIYVFDNVENKIYENEILKNNGIVIKFNIKSPFGYLARKEGILQAKTNTVLILDDDTIVDKKVLEFISLIPEVFDMIAFNRINYPVSFRDFIVKIIRKMKLCKPKSDGIYAFSKKKWIEYKCHYYTSKNPCDDSHYSQIFLLNGRFLFVENIKNIHLRNNYNSKTRQYLRGYNAGLGNMSFVKILIRSIIYFHPFLLKGWFYGKKMNVV